MTVPTAIIDYIIYLQNLLYTSHVTPPTLTVPSSLWLYSAARAACPSVQGTQCTWIILNIEYGTSAIKVLHVSALLPTTGVIQNNDHYQTLDSTEQRDLE